MTRMEMASRRTSLQENLQEGRQELVRYRDHKKGCRTKKLTIPMIRTLSSLYHTLAPIPMCHTPYMDVVIYEKAFMYSIPYNILLSLLSYQGAGSSCDGLGGRLNPYNGLRNLVMEKQFR